MTVEVRISDKGGRFPVEPQFTVEPQQETTIFENEQRLFKVFCDQSDDIGWIELCDFRGRIEVTRNVVRNPSLDPVKINSPWAGIIRGDIAIVALPNGEIAKVAHNELGGGGY